ncbi:SIMPL domain-containing protein [Bacteroidota bacterium]|nr:SIMPL domain-containing protein [Bacteroidota bacterium]
MKEIRNSVIIALTIIITALILTNAYRNRNSSSNSIAVTGLGSKDFVSDLIVWSGYFVKRNLILKDAYAQLDSDRESIKSYLIGKGVKAENLVFSAVEIEKEYETTYEGERSKSVFVGYRLTQYVTIESNEVDKIEDVSRQVSELINTGVEFYSNTPQYYYTKLAELKIQMIAEATRDANERATKIAENADAQVGKLKDASMGVFQIVAQNSSEEYSWGGSFNTASKRKTASITVRLEYEVD